MNSIKRILILIVILTSSNHFVLAQNTFVHKQFGFAMEEPKGWIVINKAALNENLTKLEFNDETIAQMLKEYNSLITFVSYQKYDPKLKTGLIPTIQVNVRSKPLSTYQEFEKLFVQSREGFNKIFEGYEVIDGPRKTQVSGISSVFIMSRYRLKAGGEVYNVRSRTYAIPLKNYFFQLNFIDGQNEDCSQEFDLLVQTVRIGLESRR